MMGQLWPLVPPPTMEVGVMKATFESLPGAVRCGSSEVQLWRVMRLTIISDRLFPCLRMGALSVLGPVVMTLTVVRRASFESFVGMEIFGLNWGQTCTVSPTIGLVNRCRYLVTGQSLPSGPSEPNIVRCLS